MELERSELLGVCVSYLADGFLRGVEVVFGRSVDPDFYEINATMLLGEGPRQLELVCDTLLTCDVGRLVTQLQSDSATVRGRVKAVGAGGRITLIETGSTFDPTRVFDLQLIDFRLRTNIQMWGRDLVALSASPTSVRGDLGWPLGKGLVCPRDGRINCSLVDALEEKGPTGSTGRATVFLSWAWFYSAHTIVSSLETWCKNSGLSMTATFVWICAFNTNQYRVQEKKQQNQFETFECFRTVFGSRIRSIGHVIALLDSWQNAAYLRRLWCLFEMATSIELDLKLEIVLPPSETNSFCEALASLAENNSPNLQRLQHVWLTLSAIDVKSATATSPSDLHNITQAIVHGVGYERINYLLQERLAEWFGSSLVLEVHNVLGSGTLLNALRCADSWTFVEEALQIRVHTRNMDDCGGQARALVAVGDTLVIHDSCLSSGSPKEDVLDDLLDMRNVRTSPSKVHFLNHMSARLVKRRRFDAALIFQDECVRIVEIAAGPSTLAYAKLGLIGYLPIYSGQKQWKKLLDVLLRIINILRESHPQPETDPEVKRLTDLVVDTVKILSEMYVIRAPMSMMPGIPRRANLNAGAQLGTSSLLNSEAVILTEEGIGRCYYYPYVNLSEARKQFKEWWCCRILLRLAVETEDTHWPVELGVGGHSFAHDTIRQCCCDLIYEWFLANLITTT